MEAASEAEAVGDAVVGATFDSSGPFDERKIVHPTVRVPSDLHRRPHAFFCYIQ